MNDDWLPAFAKLTKREPEVDDLLQLPDGATSLEALQAIYRNPGLPLTTRMRAMISALPFETPKLAVSALVDSTKDFATLLDQRIARYEKMKLIDGNGAKLIDAQPTNGEPQEAGTKPQVETKPPLARTPDRRFRRF
jgi:hypothetical protein